MIANTVQQQPQAQPEITLGSSTHCNTQYVPKHTFALFLAQFEYSLFSEICIYCSTNIQSYVMYQGTSV